MIRFQKLSTAARATDGSTIVGVLVALVFITVVTSFMVKNTVAQAANSIGYGAALVMHGTARSGIVATEGFFLKHGTAAAGFIDTLLNHNGGKFLFNANRNDPTKTRLSAEADQYFSSKLEKYENKLGGAEPYLNAGFEIDAGRNASGKTLKKAWAFYRLENLTMGSGYAPSTNAVYSKGPISNADAGMRVEKGKATFEGPVKFQNFAATFDSSVYFGSTANIQKGATFKDKAYFHEEATLQNSAIEFQESVGFNDNIKTEGHTFNTQKNVYMNGDFNVSSPANGIKGLGADDTLFHTKNLKIYDSALVGCTQSGYCPIHGAHAVVTSSTTGGNIMGYSVTKSSSTDAAVNPMDIEKKLGIGTLAQRRDPQLDISKIPGGLIISAVDAMTGSGGNFDINKLNSTYSAAKANNALYNNEYLVVKVEKNKWINFPSTNPGTFNDKMIIIIEDGATLDVGGRFYNSGPDASTLVYAGHGNAKLEQFGTQGTFRGLIYIDSLNTSNNSINFPGTSTIVGAVHNFSQQALQWNTSGNQVKIVFDQDVLMGFGPLQKNAGAAGGGSNVVLESGKNYVNPVPLGFYFP